MANLVATHYPFPPQCANAFVALSKLRKCLRPSGNSLPTLNEFACTMLECRGKFWHLPYLLEMIITAGRYSFKNLASTLALPIHKFTEEQSCLEDSPNLQPQSGIDSVPFRIDHFVSSPSSTSWLAPQQFLCCKPPTSCSSDDQPLVILMFRSLHLFEVFRFNSIQISIKCPQVELFIPFLSIKLLGWTKFIQELQSLDLNPASSPLYSCSPVKRSLGSSYHIPDGGILISKFCSDRKLVPAANNLRHRLHTREELLLLHSWLRWSKRLLHPHRLTERARSEAFHASTQDWLKTLQPLYVRDPYSAGGIWVRSTRLRSLSRINFPMSLTSLSTRSTPC